MGSEMCIRDSTIALKLGQPKILSFEEMKKVLDKAQNYKKG